MDDGDDPYAILGLRADGGGGAVAADSGDVGRAAGTAETTTTTTTTATASTATVTAAAIRGAYRRLALRYHPDKQARPAEAAAAAPHFARVAAAYELLSDPARRAAYDAEAAAAAAAARQQQQQTATATAAATSTFDPWWSTSSDTGGRMHPFWHDDEPGDVLRGDVFGGGWFESRSDHSVASPFSSFFHDNSNTIFSDGGNFGAAGLFERMSHRHHASFFGGAFGHEMMGGGGGMGLFVPDAWNTMSLFGRSSGGGNGGGMPPPLFGGGGGGDAPGRTPPPMSFAHGAAVPPPAPAAGDTLLHPIDVDAPPPGVVAAPAGATPADGRAPGRYGHGHHHPQQPPQTSSYFTSGSFQSSSRAAFGGGGGESVAISSHTVHGQTVTERVIRTADGTVHVERTGETAHVNGGVHGALSNDPTLPPIQPIPAHASSTASTAPNGHRHYPVDLIDDATEPRLARNDDDDAAIDEGIDEGIDHHRGAGSVRRGRKRGDDDNNPPRAARRAAKKRKT